MSPSLGTIPNMVDLFKAFEEKATMVRLLDQFMDPKGGPDCHRLREPGPGDGNV